MNCEALYYAIINNIYDGAYFVDRDVKITLWNKAAEAITGYRKEEILGKSCHDTPLRHIDGAGRRVCIAGCPLRGSLDDGQIRTHEVFLKHKNGYRLPITVKIVPFVENGNIAGAFEIFRLSSPHVYEDTLIENLTNSAMTDPLTGLSNRRKMESIIAYRFKELKQFNNIFSVVFLDIDNFRSFNNEYGHDTGDIVLNSISQSIKHIIRNSDAFGRWGGEEFIGVFVINDRRESVVIAEKIRALIEATELRHNGKAISVTASLGVTVANDGDTVDSVVKRADMLMYQSKRSGKNLVTADINTLIMAP